MISKVVHWSSHLRVLLQGIEPLGSFVHSQRLTQVPPLQPRISVDGGVGRLGLPIADVVVRQLIATAAKAPFGKLDETILDTNVRDAWQIDESRITIADSDPWKTYFTEMVRQHCFQLGISSERFDTLGIQANLYKMLIYEKDGHFLTHRDTEKEPHMFGTLILQLPTSDGFQGGAFTVSHRGVTERIDLSKQSDNEFQSVSFYADCQHELHPITSGTRVCLAYNLVATLAEQDKTGTLPSDDINTETEHKLRSIRDTWCASDFKDISKIGYQLEHKYTRQSICFTSLKGRDQIIARTLRNARDAQGHKLFRVSILLMKKQCTDNRYYDIHEDSTEPYIVIEETDDGLWEKNPVGGDWDMDCCSENGWWVLANENTNVIYGNTEDEDDEDDEGEDEDDHFTETPDGMSEVEWYRQMFQNPFDTEVEMESYNGNDGGDVNRFYYAAAVVISPIAAAIHAPVHTDTDTRYKRWLQFLKNKKAEQQRK